MRVWSVIISIFGDLVLPRRGDIAAGQLQTILERLGIDAGAMRTAISRLGKEGWVGSSRAGRSSIYRLSPAAVPEFDIAARTIYAPQRPAPEGGLTLVILPDGQEAPAEADLLSVQRTVHVWAGAGPVPETIAESALITSIAPGALPSWMRAALLSETLASEYRALEARFAPLAQALEAGGTLSSEDAAAARALLIHHWRRVALRHPHLPWAVAPDGWPEPTCRRFVLALHARLGEAAEPWLDHALPHQDSAARVGS